MQNGSPETVCVSFSAEINPTTTEGLLKTCSDLANKGIKTIYLLISTPGGSVANGVNAYNVLRALPPRIVTHNVGSVDSIGNVLFLAGDQRYANAGTTFMFHGVGFNITQNARLEQKALTEYLDSVRADHRKIAGIIQSRTTFSKTADIVKLFRQAATKDTKFAQDHGIIHEVREAKVPDGIPVLQLVFKR